MSIANVSWCYYALNAECVKLFKGIEMWGWRERINCLLCYLFVSFMFYRFDELWEFQHACSQLTRWIRDDGLLFIRCTSYVFDFLIAIYLLYFLHVGCALAVFGIRWWLKKQPLIVVFGNWVYEVFPFLELCNNSVWQRNCHQSKPY